MHGTVILRHILNAYHALCLWTVSMSHTNNMLRLAIKLLHKNKERTSMFSAAVHPGCALFCYMYIKSDTSNKLVVWCSFSELFVCFVNPVMFVLSFHWLYSKLYCKCTAGLLFDCLMRTLTITYNCMIIICSAG